MTNRPTNLDRFSLWVLSTLAPEDCRDAILGDAIELANQERQSLWFSALSSAFPLAGLKFAMLRWRDAIALAGFSGMVLIWEFMIARQWSWPIAREILPYSPMSTAATCMAMYVGLYGVFALAAGTLISVLSRARWTAGIGALLLTLTTLAPPIVLMALPTSVDSPIFRVSQLATIAFGLSVGHALSRHKMRRAAPA
ncbi:MAG: hypothetical protein AAGL69_14630 [Pseudomonadota bacterium]